ncbi:MAG: GAF domain-containing protein [Hyphomicrobiaceae bacterium]|nr:GAF domain-containing protein [Hyphomicrobiaceae bacterium]
MSEFSCVCEERRLRALYDLHILDTPPERAFDRITALARFTFRVPISTVTMVDRDRQWFKSKDGLDYEESPRDVAICNHTIQHSAPLVIPDTLLDERTSRNPAVLAGPRVRFYAGAPLEVGNGARVGTLCVMDTVPRTLSAHETGILAKLAGLVVEELEERAATIQRKAVAVARKVAAGGFDNL